MRKIKLLMMALASMLAIEGYAQTEEDEWVEATKNRLIKAYPEYADYINVRPDGKMIYVHQFSFEQGPAGNNTHHYLTEKSTFLLDRTMDNGIKSHFACVFKGDPDIPFEQRPEYNLTFNSILSDTYNNVFYNVDHSNAKNSVLENATHSSSSSVANEEIGREITRGGEYLLKAINNAGSEHQLQFILNSKPECRMDVEGGSYWGEEAKVELLIASGYPYSVDDYKGTKMTLEIFDADDKQLNSIPFELNASTDSARLEYVVQFEYKFYLSSSKYTFKFSGDLLKDVIVLTKDVKSYTEKLQATIEEAEALGDRILNNPKLAYFAVKADLLKDKANHYRTYLDLPASPSNQTKIEQAISTLSQQIAVVEEAMKKGIVQVYTAQELKGEIAKDPTAQIQLMQDIDLSGMTSKLHDTFRGVINGSGDNGKTYALIGRYQRSEFDNQQSSYLFEKTENAEFTNIIFKNFQVKDLEDAKPNLGVISRTANNCHYRNITMDDVYVHGYEENVGTVTGNASSCVFDKVSISNAIVYTDDQCGGGIAGCTERCIFLDCQTEPNAAIFADGAFKHSASSGGFTGTSNNDVFQGCVNHALVGANSTDMGGIAGYSSYTQFNNCINMGRMAPCAGDKFWKIQKGELYIADITYSDNTCNIGGICGNVWYGSAEQCINDGLICGKSVVGGILGLATDVTINNCLNTILNSDVKGAIVGSSSGCDITNCLSTVDCKLISGVYKSTCVNNYSLLMPDSKRTTGTGEMGVSQAQLKSGIVARWLNNGYENRKEGVAPWRQNIELQGGETQTDNYPVLNTTHRVVTTEQLTRGTVINDYKQLLAFAKRVNDGDQFACASLGADIDMTHIDWTPIGLNADHKHFRGIFDGRGHTIMGLKCTSNNNEPVGLFGAVHANAEICNVTVGDGSEFVSAGDEGAGGIVGRVAIGWSWGIVVIENCGSHASILVNKHGGGILGRVSTEQEENHVRVFVNNCYSVGTVTAKNGNSGLLCGYMKHTGVVSNSWSAGLLKSNAASGVIVRPFNIENPKDQGEYLVGYDTKLEIQDSYIVNPENQIDYFDTKNYPVQEGVMVISDKEARSGELAYRLNKGVTDGTQPWYQRTFYEPYPVRTKQPNGINMVYKYVDSNGNEAYGNTSYSDILEVIFNPSLYESNTVTDINKSGDVDVTDLTTFTEAANR